jgi:hypothetical protein
MSRKITYNRQTRYVGHENEEIISLMCDLNDVKAEIRRIEGDIEKIQDNCVHQYLLSCKGPYEDLFECKLCGHEIWI